MPGRALLDALDDDPALAGVLTQFRTDRAGIEENMITVQALMRPPADPFHERLAAVYPQIRRFVPTLIEALDLEAIDSARPVLAAYRALGDWLAGKPRTARRPADELPLEVVTPSWRPRARSCRCSRAWQRSAIWLARSYARPAHQEVIVQVMT